jgi:nucleoside-diphosphate-sugar epimerase
VTRPVAAVTGGTGFLGRHVVVALCKAGWEVRLLARRDPVHPLLAGCTFEVVPGDLGNPDSLSRLVQGADVVVHAAALVKAKGAAEFMAINRDGTAELAAIVARDAPAARFVLISSQAARTPHISAYARSKRAGEEAMQAALPRGDWVILRPCVVYGPWDLEGIATLRLAIRRTVPVPAAPEPRIAMLHARDAAASVVAVCGPGPSAVVYELSDERTEGYGWREIVETAALPFGRTPRFQPLPDLAFLGAGLATDVWASITRKPAVFGRGKAREILYRDWSSDRGLQPPAELWRPTIGLKEGLAETVAWWRSEMPAGSA